VKLERLIPISAQAETGVSLKATAGLRQLPEHSQEWLIEVVRGCLSQSGFHFLAEETRVIDGKEEAFFGWMTVAIAFKAHQNHLSAPQTRFIGALDMGGASKQIAFILRDKYCEQNGEICRDSCRGDWMLNIPGAAAIVTSSLTVSQIPRRVISL
jgi:Golgi nucleoside diphosphatase